MPWIAALKRFLSHAWFKSLTARIQTADRAHKSEEASNEVLEDNDTDACGSNLLHRTLPCKRVHKPTCCCSTCDTCRKMSSCDCWIVRGSKQVVSSLCRAQTQHIVEIDVEAIVNSNLCYSCMLQNVGIHKFSRLFPQKKPNHDFARVAGIPRSQRETKFERKGFRKLTMLTAGLLSPSKRIDHRDV